MKRKVEIVKYHNPSKKRNDGTKAKPNVANQKSSIETKFLKSKDLLAKLEFDVNTFALSGFTKEEKRKREKERAVKLGAKARKGKSVNYKEFLQQRKASTANISSSSSQNETDNCIPSNNKKAKKDDDRRKKTVFWQEPTKMKGKFGTIGTYKNGILKISKEELKLHGLNNR